MSNPFCRATVLQQTSPCYGQSPLSIGTFRVNPSMPGQLTDSGRLSRLVKEGQFIQNAGEYENVAGSQALGEHRERIHDAVHAVRQIQQDIGVNAQAQGLHDRTGAQRLVAAADDVALR